jgi:hypothetical protein
LTSSLAPILGAHFTSSFNTAADETLELEWFTLALGEPFIRVSQEDDYLAGRWDQIEARGRYQVHDPMVSPIYLQITVLSPVSDV